MKAQGNLTCKLESCDRVVRAAMLCSRHYRALQEYGDPEAVGPPLNVAALMREMASSTTPDCIRWPRSEHDWYHSVHLSGETYSKAHRVICQIRHGEPLEGQVAMHACNNKWCINGRHLSWGFPEDNTAQALQDGLMHCGERQHLAKLTDDMVVEIRRRWDSGRETLDEIAADYPATRGAIWLAARRKTWRHVSDAVAGLLK